MAEVRYMKEADLEQVLRWRNHPDIRSKMYTQHEISWEEHARWFERTKSDENVHLLIYEDPEPLGFISFKSSVNQAEAVWGFYVAPDAPAGTGVRMGHSALDFAFSELGYEVIKGEVISFNRRSSGYHEKLGFTRHGKLVGKYQENEKSYDIEQFCLTAQQWNKIRGMYHGE
ncbi:UDP-4-amino-4,6-dideoxy-N-acetyl-beta-L-altrosamine N-acetyltransferase [Thalassolituus sp. LLYu03]|uniref:UDP-4-amino-4, 6-dideoxy-N-acetyl-beta-L-altrosamine N-acetyltransferase n=1 Tax=Thalassolituus sp. LLYu03 TaxID=3421656 RepID=UPI003D26775F